MQLETFRKELESELVDNILVYWGTKMVDTVNGGFYGVADHFGTPVEDGEKGIVLNARILWTFSAAYRLCGNERYLELAKRAKDYIETYFWDHTHGGVYWMLDAKGNPTNRKKQTYAQAFTLYGYSEYYRATQCEEAMKRMIDLEVFIERHTWDLDNHGYVEALAEDTSMLQDMRLSELDINCPKSNNTHLHILEAYANLYRAYPMEHTRLEIERLLKLYKDVIITDRPSCEGFFTMDWKPMCDFQSFGHDIEASWLLWDAVETVKSVYTEEYRKLIVDMVEESLNKGLDREGGGLFYEKMEGKPRNDEKQWWAQAEAVLGLINAYQVTAKDSYLELAGWFWDYIKNNLSDPQYGDWHTYLTTDGKVGQANKTSPWKCPYHNGRACIEGILRLQAIEAARA